MIVLKQYMTNAAVDLITQRKNKFFRLTLYFAF